MTTNQQPEQPDESILRTLDWQAKATAARLVLAVQEHDQEAFYRSLRYAFSGALPHLAPAVMQVLARDAAIMQGTILGDEDARDTTDLYLRDLDLTCDPDYPGQYDWPTDGPSGTDPE